MSDQDIMDNFDSLVMSQPDCKMIQARMERDPLFFDKVFEHVMVDFPSYCRDGSTNHLALKVVELGCGQISRAKRIV